MNPEETNAIIQLFLRYGFEAVVAAIIVFLLIKSFLPGYLSQKGKNLATQEDIELITRKVERIRTEYSFLLENLKAKHQMRFAAIDRRLEVHQQAFTLWRQLIQKVHTDEIGGTVIECQRWWEGNCLYLELRAREAFSAAYHAANLHPSLLQNNDHETRNNWKVIMDAGDIIVSTAELPGLTDTERIELTELEKSIFKED